MFHVLQTLLVLVFPALVIFAAVRDVASYTIANWISLALLAAFPLAALATGLPPVQIGLHLAVGLAALVLVMAMFAAGWIGGGDAKLFAAAAVWLGLGAQLSYVVGVCLAGGLLTLALLALRSPRLRAVVLAGPPWLGRLGEPGGSVPYGVAIAAGALTAFPQSDLVRLLAAG